jgi:hypothetical protein
MKNMELEEFFRGIKFKRCSAFSSTIHPTTTLLNGQIQFSFLFFSNGRILECANAQKGGGGFDGMQSGFEGEKM